MEYIVVGSFKINFKEGDIIRIEKRSHRCFDERATLFCSAASSLKNQKFHSSVREGVVHIQFKDYEMTLPQHSHDLKNLKINLNGEEVYSHKNIRKNSGELPFPSKTPNIFPLLDHPRIYLPKHYRAADIKHLEIDESGYTLYLFLSKKDPALLRQQFVSVCGRSLFPPLAAFGVWDSKYFEYNDESILSEIKRFEEYDIPLDNFVVDTDWRKPHGRGGSGYTINTKDFPDLRETFARLHSMNLSVTFNDHPEPVNGAASAFDIKEVKYRRKNLLKLLKMGLDYWWYDRNWWTRLLSPSKGLSPETMGMYIYQDVTSQYYKKKGNRRPLIMGNVDNIHNGTYLGISNSASHLYSIQWTGDTKMDREFLEQEFADMIKCANNNIPYMSSDLSGHFGDGDDDLYVRWMQYGALSPIFRFHATKGLKRYREPWLYGEEALKITRDLLKMRYRLFPYFYALAHENYENGISLIRSLDYYENSMETVPMNEAFLGNKILFGSVIPVDTTSTAPESFFKTAVVAKFYENCNLKGNFVQRRYKKIDFDWSKRAPLRGFKKENYSATFKTKICADKDVKLMIGSDDGVRVYLDGKLVVDAWFNRGFTYDEVAILHEGEIHDLYIEYFQGSMGAGLKVSIRNVNETRDSAFTYLPHGEFLSLFDGKTYDGNQTLNKKYPVDKFPLFIKLPAIVPLWKDRNNTKDIRQDDVCLDIYLSTNGNDQTSLYFDDGETMNFLDGEYNEYKASIECYQSHAVIKVSNIHTCEKDLPKIKKLHFRFHETGDIHIKECTINGKEVISQKYLIDKNSPLFAFDGASRDSNILEFEVDVASCDSLITMVNY